MVTVKLLQSINAQLSFDGNLLQHTLLLLRQQQRSKAPSILYQDIKLLTREEAKIFLWKDRQHGNRTHAGTVWRQTDERFRSALALEYLDYFRHPSILQLILHLVKHVPECSIVQRSSWCWPRLDYRSP